MGGGHPFSQTLEDGLACGTRRQTTVAMLFWEGAVSSFRKQSSHFEIT